MNKPCLLFALVLLFGFSCSKKTVFTTPEALGESVFEAIRNNDLVSFRKFIVNKSDETWILKNTDEPERAKEVVEYKIQGWAAYDEKVLTQLHQEGKTKGVDWKTAQFVRVEYEVKAKHVPNKADIYIHFTSAGNPYQLKLDDCLKLGRGWVVFDDVTFED